MSNLSNLKVSVKTDLSAKPFKPVHQFIDKTTTTQQMQQVSNIIVQLWSSCPWKTEWGKGRTLDNLVPPQNYRWQNRKECKGKTNAAQSEVIPERRCRDLKEDGEMPERRLRDTWRRWRDAWKEMKRYLKGDGEIPGRRWRDIWKEMETYLEGDRKIHERRYCRELSERR